MTFLRPASCSITGVKRYLPSILLTLGIAWLAPYVGVLRKELFESFPMGSLLAVGGCLLLIAGGALLYAFLRIRSRRVPRFLGLIGAVLLVWGQNFGFGAGDIEVNVIEKIHIVEYGLLAWWIYLALLRGSEEAEGDLSLLLLPLVGVCLAGTLDETVQGLVATRSGDVQDIGLDVYSGACGLLFALSLEPPQRFSWHLGRRKWVLRWAALAILGVGLFFSQAHLGYMIEDPEIGQFRSWHRPEVLKQLAGRRAVAWRVEPPGTKTSPWRLEDRYLTEAGWHQGHRARNAELGYYYWTLQANRILEKYYAPYLGLENFGRPGVRRFSPEVLRKVEAKSAHFDPRFYRSPVLSGRVYVWPTKKAFLLGLAGVVLLLLLASLPNPSTRPSVSARR